MSLRSLLQLDPSLQGKRWQISIVLPALLAGALVTTLAWQSMRALQVHRRAVDTALHDYSAFAAWQYTRRASDYLRLTIVTSLPPASAHRIPVSCAVRDGHVSVGINETQYSKAEVGQALEGALRRLARSRTAIGLVAVGDARDHRFLGYWFANDSSGEPTHCEARLVDGRELAHTLDHVARFAPLLPPSLTGDLPSDSLVSIRVLDTDGARIAAIGGSFTGLASTDTLGPDLADLRVVTTLHPLAAKRLVVGGMPKSNLPALAAMLAVTFVLCVVAVMQLRRTHQIVQLRSDFVASVSHELKTPLAQISLFADTLASPRERGPAERRRYLSIISRESKRLGQLVDSILHFAGMMHGPSRPPSHELASLGEEIRDAVLAFEPLAAARSVKIITRFAGDVDLPLERDGFRQLLLNLLDNALKYGPDGQRIVVTLTALDDRARIWIDDEGPGIPIAERESAFEPFVRADRDGNKAGSGIGLAVVRDVARRHGGTVRAQESPRGGARIEIELPISASAVVPANAPVLVE